MNRERDFDEELVGRLPLPLAQIYRRAHHAKMALERHQTAYYLWEAALKLLASVAMVEAAELENGDSRHSPPPAPPAWPGVADWWEMVGELVSRLAESDPEFQSLQDFFTLPLAGNLPQAAALDALLQEPGEGA